MRKSALAILFFLLASPAGATTYYLATAGGGGSDSNSGTSASTPWLTPSHAVNCGDVIIAAPSTAYVYTNFSSVNWGTVTCAAGNNVAWLKCATFDACKISVNTTDVFAVGMLVNNSYWGVQGWEISTSRGSGGCFLAYTGGPSIHHIIFANDIANGCGEGGFGDGPTAPFGVDYFVVIGSIAYNAVQGSENCNSGINADVLVATDSLPGTHVYFAGNFSFDNVDGNPCNGSAPTDGQGLMLDTLEGNGSNIPPFPYPVVIENNISIYNGGRGIENVASTQTPVYFRHNTTYGNNTDPHQVSQVWCAEVGLVNSVNTQEIVNLTETTAATSCGGNTIYNYYVYGGNGTVSISNNWGYSALGNNAQSSSSNGFSFGINTFNNPNFANPTNPGAPSCGSFASVPACMATVIANFTPMTPAAVPYGYQVPRKAQIYDPLFPQWLCNVNLPAGLVTMGCLTQSSLPASPTITGVKVQ
jgi:hypothetical protein